MGSTNPFPRWLSGRESAVHETQVQPLGQVDPLEKEMVTLSCILAWEIQCTEEPGGLQSMRLQKSQTRLKRLNNNILLPSTLSSVPNFRNYLVCSV